MALPVTTACRVALGAPHPGNPALLGLKYLITIGVQYTNRWKAFKVLSEYVSSLCRAGSDSSTHTQYLTLTVLPKGSIQGGILTARGVLSNPFQSGNPSAEWQGPSVTSVPLVV